ncbi:hypothetical protein SXCC_02765 [Gluconacetobacter sp. SXCC-1]|nr:hypothetical protein SXCC_02765 [Gluconacetobacter sp. SXCC-1]
MAARKYRRENRSVMMSSCLAAIFYGRGHRAAIPPRYPYPCMKGRGPQPASGPGVETGNDWLGNHDGFIFS